MQLKREVGISGPLGDDVLLFHRMAAMEQLGRLFEFEVDLLSKDEQIKFQDVLGQVMTVHLELPSGNKRHFNGFATRFSQVGKLGNYAAYRCVLRPWLWFLTRTADCRIFQEMSAPDIIKQIFRDQGFTDFEESLSEQYRTRQYCVQYRETDFNFVSRLMEEEGIYYYFKHEENRHVLVLSDSYSAHNPIPEHDQIPYRPPTETLAREEDHVFDWQLAQEIQPGMFSLNDFDFERPKAGLAVKSSVKRQHPYASMEIYDYPGNYLMTKDGEAYARARIEELQAQFEQARGKANARNLIPGGLFKLTEHPREDQNREYLVVSVAHDVRSQEYESKAAAEAGALYECSFTVIDSHQPYRSPRLTQKPVVQGPQTAVVTGKPGEEIWTDKFGRVKIQFHWDREGKNDESSSCWVRVSQPWAGKSWGSVSIPRIGQEVVVDFLEGDPDRPLITGRVYNADQMPPYGLPAAGMVSGFKSNSTPGGGGYNEISADDTKGQEKVTIHGQYDMGTTVEHDQTLTVHNCRTSTIDVDDTESVGSNQSVTVGADQTISVGANQTETVGANQTLGVGANQTITVGAARSLTVGASESVSVGSSKTETIAVAKALTIGAAYQVSVGAAMNETVGGAKAQEIGGAKIVLVGGVSTEAVGANKSVSAGGKISESAGGKLSCTSGAAMSLSAGGDLTASSKAKATVDAASQIALKCGGAAIILKSGGEITIQGTKITVKGSKITVDGSGEVTIKGSSIKEN